MRQNQIHGIVQNRVSKRAHVLGRHCAGLIGLFLRQARHKLIDIKGKVIVLVAKVLVERRAANHGAVAQHGNRQVLKTMLLEKLGKGIEQSTIGFLDAKVHPYRHPQGKDNTRQSVAYLTPVPRTLCPGANPTENITLTGKLGTAKRCGYTSSVNQRQLAHAAAAIRNGDIMITVIIGIVVVIVIVCAIAGIYNNMVTKRNRIDNAWQNIDTQLQRRNDLIPNLVETVKGYAKHEQETLSAVISARNTAVKATTPEAKMEADNVLTGALRQLFAVAEAYPDLKANTNFTQLQASLEDTENKISYARQSYNDCVLSYNNAIQTFPAVIFAGIFQFKERQGFEAAEAARQAPTVKF